jgi:hypothetical protein
MLDDLGRTKKKTDAMLCDYFEIFTNLSYLFLSNLTFHSDG